MWSKGSQSSDFLAVRGVHVGVKYVYDLFLIKRKENKWR